MKTTIKKFVGGLMVVMIIATIGVIITSAQTDETNSDDIYQKPFEDKQQLCEKPFMLNEIRIGPFFYNLTEEQKTELKELIQNLKESGANSSEIRNAIQDKLDEYGVLDEQLDNAIEETELRLNILNREKELREQGHSWDEIKQIIQDEFEFEAPVGEYHGMMFRHGGHNFRADNGFFGCFGNK